MSQARTPYGRLPRFIQTETELPAFKHFVMSILTILCCLFIAFAAYFARGQAIIWFLIVLAVALGVGAIFEIGKRRSA